MASAIPFARYASRGALIDLVTFCISFLFPGGPHGPGGPVFVLWGLNWPGAALAYRIVPERSSSHLVDVFVAFVSVALTGAAYGLAIGAVIAAWRLRRA